MMILMVMNTLFLVLLVLFIKVIPIRVYRYPKDSHKGLWTPIRVYRYPKDFLKIPSPLIPFTSDTFISNKKEELEKTYMYIYICLS